MLRPRTRTTVRPRLRSVSSTTSVNCGLAAMGHLRVIPQGVKSNCRTGEDKAEASLQPSPGGIMAHYVDLRQVYQYGICCRRFDKQLFLTRLSQAVLLIAFEREVRRYKALSGIALIHSSRDSNEHSISGPCLECRTTPPVMIYHPVCQPSYQ